MKSVRCAIYTRKSSDEGPEQAFNSLDAQQESCAAYILGQASEGWTALPDIYDDGGLSGGTLERPALQRLLAEVAAGHVDIIVIYKVDRLTRSLLDFSKQVRHASKGHARYRYCISACNQTGTTTRIPAREIETAVVERVAKLFDDPLTLRASAGGYVAADRYGDVT